MTYIQQTTNSNLVRDSIDTFPIACISASREYLIVCVGVGGRVFLYLFWCVKLSAPRFFYIGTGVSLLSRERFLYI